jgi:AcrR family transcriptional regulator
MAVERLTPERRRQLTRDALLDAAAQVFARRGFHGASLDEIAETAGFTRGAIYKHFSDKEDLLFAVSERFNERALQGFSELLGTTGPADNLPAVAARWMEMHVKDPEFFMLGAEFNLYLLRNPTARARAVERRRDQTRRIAAFMEETDEAVGVTMPMPAQDLATMFVTTADGFTMASLIDPEIAKLYGAFLEIFVRGAWGDAFTTAATDPPPTETSSPQE